MLSNKDLKITMGGTEQTQPTYEERFEEGHKDVSTVKGQGKGDSVSCCWGAKLETALVSLAILVCATHTSNFSSPHQADVGKRSTLPHTRAVLMMLLLLSTLGCSLLPLCLKSALLLRDFSFFPILLMMITYLSPPT